MSELMNARNGGRDFRGQLLTTVSALALFVAMYGTSKSEAADQDTDRPTVWIELGGQLEKIDTGQLAFVPPFFSVQPSFTTITPGQVQKPLDYSIGAEGSISFQPEGSDWIFSAAARYGRSNGSKHVHQSTTLSTRPKYINDQQITAFTVPRPNHVFADVASERSEAHAIVDFRAGRDVGLGMFGKDSQSTVNFGVRFAQFHSALQATLDMDSNIGGYKYFTTGSGQRVKFPINNPHPFQAEIRGTRSFLGMGPAISWDGSAPVAGNSDRAEFTLDWGVNAALLFGRQRASIHHQTTAHTRPGNLGSGYINNTVYQHVPPTRIRFRTVTVPNVGGMAGLSLKFPNAKVSLGYRADFFFGAMDGGIDAAKKENVGFYGPFATISVGLGG